MGAVSFGRIRRPGRGAGVPARSPRRESAPERNSLSPSTSFPTPFSAAPVAVATLILGPGRLSLGLELDSLVPRSCPSSWWQSSPRPSPIVYLRCPITCLQLDAFSINLNVFRCVQNLFPRPGLLLGLIRARARCSPRGTSFGRSMQPRPPNSGGDGGGFLPSRKCLGTPSTRLL